MQDHSPISRTVARACTASAGTVQALAEEVGVSYAALCSWSRARRQPPPHRLRKLADVLESRAEQLRELAAELREQAGDTRPAEPVVRESQPEFARRGETAVNARIAREWAQVTSERARNTRESARATMQKLSARDGSYRPMGSVTLPPDEPQRRAGSIPLPAPMPRK